MQNQRLYPWCAQNKEVSDIIHGLNVSVASKVGALAARLGKNNPGEYMMTGGVAKNQGIIQALEEKLGAKLYICDEAQLCGALGAAIFAYENVKILMYKRYNKEIRQ